LVTRTEFLYIRWGRNDRWPRESPYARKGFCEGGRVIRPRKPRVPCKNGKGSDDPRKTKPAG